MTSNRKLGLFGVLFVLLFFFCQSLIFFPPFPAPALAALLLLPLMMMMHQVWRHIGAPARRAQHPWRADRSSEKQNKKKDKAKRGLDEGSRGLEGEILKDSKTQNRNK
jgi:hypothetical protein